MTTINATIKRRRGTEAELKNSGQLLDSQMAFCTDSEKILWRKDSAHIVEYLPASAVAPANHSHSNYVRTVNGNGPDSNGNVTVSASQNPSSQSVQCFALSFGIYEMSASSCILFPGGSSGSDSTAPSGCGAVLPPVPSGFTGWKIIGVSASVQSFYSSPGAITIKVFKDNETTEIVSDQSTITSTGRWTKKAASAVQLPSNANQLVFKIASGEGGQKAQGQVFIQAY